MAVLDADRQVCEVKESLSTISSPYLLDFVSSIFEQE